MEDATRYCQALTSHLSDGGIFIDFGNNPFEGQGGKQYQHYGFTKRHSSEAYGDSDSDGAWVDYCVEGITQPLRNYNLFPESYH